MNRRNHNFSVNIHLVNLNRKISYDLRKLPQLLLDFGSAPGMTNGGRLAALF